MNQYIEEAKKFYEEAIKEFEKGEKEKDMMRIRDASEKAWNATLQATDGLIVKKGIDKPRSHYERRKILAELEGIDGEIREKGFRDRYMAREQRLHEDCFYTGICPIPLIEEDIQKVKKYIEDIEEL